jgi:hypothetical protein
VPKKLPTKKLGFINILGKCHPRMAIRLDDTILFISIEGVASPF